MDPLNDLPQGIADPIALADADSNHELVIPLLDTMLPRHLGSRTRKMIEAVTDRDSTLTYANGRIDLSSPSVLVLPTLSVDAAFARASESRVPMQDESNDLPWLDGSLDDELLASLVNPMC